VPARLSRTQRERFLDGRHIAVLVTVGADGAPQPAPIWYRHRDGLLYFRTDAASAKIANIRRDSRVSVCIQDERPPYKALIVHGTAELRDDVPGLAAEIPRHYLGLVGAIGFERSARAAIEGSAENVVIVVRPERYFSSDYAPETPWFGRLWLVVKRVLPPWL
jgi:PPOX class probable F420-dependent enzyme